MKRIARNKLTSKAQKIQGPVFLKISRIFKIDFLTIYNTLTPKLCQRKILKNRYTFVSISLHFYYPSARPFIQMLNIRFLVICSFEHKLRFHRALLYLETSYQRSVIQIYLFTKAISRAKHLQFAQKAVIMNKNHRIGGIL